jgi:hypothetical protein
MRLGRKLAAKLLYLTKKRSFWLTTFILAGGALALGIKQFSSRNSCVNRPQIGSYYYPWYTTSRWENDQDVLGKPSLGFYDNSDKKVINMHLAWASEAGIDYLIYSWLGTDSRKHKIEIERSENFIKQAHNSGIKVMPLYETRLALNQPPDNIDLDKKISSTEKAGDRFINDMLYFANQAKESGVFLKVNGCPRISIYLARNLINSESYFERLKIDLAKRGQCLDITADVAFWGSSHKPLARSVRSSKEQWDWLAKNFSTVFGYNMYSDNLNVYGINKNMSFDNLYLQAKRKNQKAWKERSDSAGLKYQYSVQPGYDDRALRGMDRPAIPPSSVFLRRDWDRIFANLEYGDHVLITSFNEWYEGTAIEPSEQDGEKLINANQKIATRIKNKFCM